MENPVSLDPPQFGRLRSLITKIECQHVFKFLKTEMRLKESKKQNPIKDFDVYIEQKVDVFFCEKCLKYEEVLLTEDYYPGFQTKN